MKQRASGKRFCKLWWLVAFIIASVLLESGMLQNTYSQSSTSTVKATSASTGTLFLGEKTRSFTFPLLLQDESRHIELKGKYSFPRLTSDCDRWAVVTTINPPTEGVSSVAALSEWCLVIVGDTKTPKDYAKTGKLENYDHTVYFLSIEEQRTIQHEFIQSIPDGSFARKILAISLRSDTEQKSSTTLTMTMSCSRIWCQLELVL